MLPGPTIDGSWRILTGSPGGTAKFLATLGLAVLLCFRLRALMSGLVECLARGIAVLHPPVVAMQNCRILFPLFFTYYFKGLLPDTSGPMKLEFPPT